MSTISQRIPNLLLGVSQQPDKLKYPGQVREASNVFPDYALGLLKRPGGKFEAELYDAEARGRWFPILRDENEKYVSDENSDGVFYKFYGSNGVGGEIASGMIGVEWNYFYINIGSCANYNYHF